MEIFTILGVAWAILLALRFLAEKAEAEKQVERFKQEADKRIRIVKLEQIPDQKLILAYDIENAQFLGQGSSEDEVKVHIMQRFPEKVFILNDKIFSALKGNVEVQLENSTTR